MRTLGSISSLWMTVSKLNHRESSIEQILNKRVRCCIMLMSNIKKASTRKFRFDFNQEID
jgi:hypothetical protein